MQNLFIGGQEMILLIPLFCVGILYLYTLFHCVSNQQLDGTKKVIWFLIILAAPLLGSLLYLAIGKGDRKTYT
jgi:hypothetical protein